MVAQVDSFIAAARALGLVIEGEPLANTERPVRVPVEGRGRRDRPGWYALRVPATGRAWAAFGRFDTGARESWREGADKPLTQAERKAIDEQRQAAEQQQARVHQRAAGVARALWESAGDANGHPYLARKGVEAIGVRQLGERLVIPLRNAAGELRSAQFVYADGSKRYLRDGEKVGCLHWLGEPKGAAVALIAEGYATAASLHAATSYAVAAAMDAGNLAAVARAVRKQLGAEARILICGDDDRDTQARTGKNPGRDAAKAAAKACAGRWCVPHGLEEGQTDFNDLHQVRGLDAVREQIEAALVGRAATAQTPAGVDRFRLDAAGVWFLDRDRDGRELAPLWICSPLEVIARTRDVDGGDWGYLVQLTDPEGTAHRWAMPARMLSTDGAEYRAALLSLGLRIAPGAKPRALISEYLQTRQPSAFARCTDRTGWHGRAFVFVDRTIGNGGEEVIFQAAGAVASAFRARCSALEWRERVGALCRRNSRLLFGVSAGFAAPLLHWARLDSFVVHFRGPSSSGKTTVARVAASLFGPPEFVETWRATSNALEGVAASHSDALLCLDEVAELDPREVIAVAYQIANQQGKARMSRMGVNRERLRWRIVCLSTGELSLEQHAASAGKRQTAGAEVRVIDLPAEPVAGAGVFEDLHGERDGDAFARRLARESGDAYGAVGPEWIERIAANPEAMGEAARRAAAEFVGATAPGTSGQVARAAARFGLVGFAGEAATAAGLTGWAKGEALAAARTCFRAWLDARGGGGNLEERQILAAVRAFLQAHGQSRAPWLHRLTDDHAPDKPLRIGYRVLMRDGQRVKPGDDFEKVERGFADSVADDGTELHHWIFPEVFRAETCVGFDHRFAARLLLDRGWLRGERDGEHVRPDRKERTPLDGALRFYCFTPRALGEDY
ncbi:DUF927 domain-containing protein [Betaproteobacteria bacterium PRO7]|nr:DUF927 domain-containing protein [Betaproteobacteria bacterium PRO7]